MKILFMGTPDFAAVILKALQESRHDVIGAVSQPDKPQGRKMILTPTAVKAYAMSANIPVYQPETLKNGALLPVLEELLPDVIVVAAYGRLLPKAVLEFAKYGCINVHASLLPKYRGAAPIQWAVINGEEKTGVTIMQMAAGLDTGDILYVKETPIGQDETAGELFDRLAPLGAQALLEALDQLEQGKIVAQKQNDDEATHAPMLDKSIAQIDGSLSPKLTKAKIQGLLPWPGGYVTLFGKKLKLLDAKIVNAKVFVPAGHMVPSPEKDRLWLGCDGGVIEIANVLPEGSRAMPAKAYLAGHPFEDQLINQ